MYRDTEQTYRNWNIDCYESNCEWVAECWSRSDSRICFESTNKRRKQAIIDAKKMIDDFYAKEKR